MEPPELCPLCTACAETIVWRGEHCRVILVSDADYPGYCRVIWNAHVAELSDLGTADRTRLLDAVCATETALREAMHPDKINLASLGNLVPHLHWHVIPRFRDDTHFPQSIWGVPQRPGVRRQGPDIEALGQRIDAALTGTGARHAQQ